MHVRVTDRHAFRTIQLCTIGWGIALRFFDDRIEMETVYRGTRLHNEQIELGV